MNQTNYHIDFVLSLHISIPATHYNSKEEMRPKRRIISIWIILFQTSVCKLLYRRLVDSLCVKDDELQFVKSHAHQWKIIRDLHISCSTLHNIIKWPQEFQCIKGKGANLNWTPMICHLSNHWCVKNCHSPMYSNHRSTFRNVTLFYRK